MSDQAIQQSPESRLQAMLGDVIDEPIVNEEPLEVEEEITDEVDETEEVEESEDDEPELETEDEVDSEEEAEEEESEEQPTKMLKLKVNGEEVEKPLDEVVALAQQGLDYTKKTQEVAEQRKELDILQEQLNVSAQQFQEQQQLNSMLIEDVAKITALDQQLNQYQNVDWQQLSDSDFVEAQKLFFSYNQLQKQRSDAVSQFEAKKQVLVTKQQQDMASKLAKGKEALSKKIPNWSPETTQKLISVGKDYGFSDAELNSIVDPRHVEVLHDAMQWRNLKNNSVGKKKVSRAQPVVKPGAKDTKNRANNQSKQMRERLRKTGSSDLASKLIEDMI